MNFCDLFRLPDVNQGVADYHRTPDSLLLDVRTPQEYQEGRIPGSQNIPLQTIVQIHEIAEQKDTPLFVYCRSGARSRQAASLLQNMGYTNVSNIGGIATYTGKLEM